MSNYKCPFCNQLFDAPGYHQHGKAKVELKPRPIVPGSYIVDNRFKPVYGGGKSDN